MLPTSFSKNKKRQECCYKWSNRAMLVRVNWTRDTQEVDSVWYRHIIYEGVEITSVTGQIMNEFSNLCPFHCCSNSVRHTGTVRKYKKSSLSAGSTTAQAIEDNRKSQYSTLSMLTGFWMVCLQPPIVELQFSNSAGLMIKCNACSISHMTCCQPQNIWCDLLLPNWDNLMLAEEELMTEKWMCIEEGSNNIAESSQLDWLFKRYNSCMHPVCAISAVHWAFG